MALKIFEGWDHYNNGKTDMLARSGFLQWQLPSPATDTDLSFVTGLTGYGKALRIHNNQFIATQNSPVRGVWANRDQEAFIGIRMQIDAGNSMLVSATDTVGGTNQVTLFFNVANYTVAAYRNGTGGTLLGLSANNSWQGGRSFYLSFHYKISTSGGVVEVKIDSTTVLNLTSKNTQQSANAWADAIDFFPTGPQHSYVNIDDLYYNDTTTGPGTYPCNTFLGDVRCATLFATGNDVVQFLPLANQNWQEINEQAMDSNTSYNYDSTVGHQDTFVFQPLTGVLSIIYGLQLTFAGYKDDGGLRQVQGVVKISGTSYLSGVNHDLAMGSYGYGTDSWVLNPATSLNWTLSDVNAAVYGYNLSN